VKELILHVGAAKCGSTTIQTLLKKASSKKANTCFHYQKLNTQLINGLRLSKPEALRTCQGHLNTIQNKQKLVISHEYLQEQYKALANIIQLAKEFDYKFIQIIGYTRRQDSWRRANFNQWSFRNKYSLIQAKTLLSKLGCDWRLFSAYERWLLLGFFEQEGPNWALHYQHYKSCLSQQDIAHNVVSRPIPCQKEKPSKLLHHFNKHCNTNIKAKLINACTAIKNPSFSEYLTETIADSILLTPSSLSQPITPHKNNKDLAEISHNLDKQLPAFNMEFLETLEKNYLSIFSDSNKRYCDEFNLCFDTHFKPNPAHFNMNSETMKTYVRSENKRRLNHIETILQFKIEQQAKCTQAILQQLTEADPTT